MSDIPYDEDREQRITMEIIVDAYGPEEVAAAWPDYLANTLRFPFHARHTRRRTGSYGGAEEVVDVIGMVTDEDGLDDIYILINWEGDECELPLAEIEPIDADEKTKQAVEDWRYWVGRGYELGGDDEDM